jgi:eukaryotic-like serine/threonine-protein kinase
VAHLDESTIARFIERRLPEDEVHRLQHHLDDCEDCRSILASLAKLSIMRLADGSTQPAYASPSGGVRGRGDRIDRYVVLDLVGAGAMGAVYAAFDPDLDRKVAVKLLHARVPDGDTRMLREAQALARVAHPNVIGVHDVGTYDGHVFIAMEYVAGTTFRAWVEGRKRSWQDIVARGVEAARGLAAAHAAGLVHRDVKPDNILVHDRGVARIGDFGLASSTGEVPERDPLVSSKSTFDVQLTAPNTIIGTPAYMAPEQLAGRAASARSDQFGFCVTLYEALYGTRPYPGATIEEIVQAMETGKVAAPVHDRGVPKRVRTALVRGLAVDPAARFPTTDDLVDELAHQPLSRRRIAAVGLGAVAIVGLTAATMRASDTAPCQSAPGELARVWSPARRAQVEQAITALGLPFGADTAARVTGALDGYGAAWVGHHEQACKATAIHRTQSAALRDRRINCLARRLIQLDAVVSTIVATDRDGARHAVDAARGLPSLATCADPDRLAHAPDPSIAADVTRITGDIARGQAVLDLGTPDKAATIAKAAVADADKLAYDPLVAAAHDLLGQASVQTGDMKLARDSLERAVVAATRASDEQAEARSLASLALVLRNTSPDGQIAIAHARHALAIAERAKQAPLFEAQIRYANILVMAGVDYDAVVENYKRGSALLETATGNADTLRVDYQTIDAKLSINPFEALDKYAIALATAERAYGPSHPQVAAVLVEMANSAIVAEQPDNARAFAQRAAKLLAPYPGDRVELRRIDAKLERDPKLRRPILEEVVRATEATAPRSAQLAFDREELADTLLELHAFREGLVHIDGAITIWDALYDGQFEAMVTSLVTKAQLHAGLEDWPAVAAAGERANALAEKGGMRKLVQSMARLLLVDSYFRQKRWADALALLAKAAPSIRLALLGDPSTKVLDFYDAACRWELGQDRPVQLARARAAIAEVRTSPSYIREPDALEPFDAWLAGKR